MSFESSSTAADNAAVLQLFLETYFMELLSQRQLLIHVEVPNVNKYFRNFGEGGGESAREIKKIKYLSMAKFLKKMFFFLALALKV